MLTDELPGWATRLPAWVRDDETRWLAKRPWIAGFIRPDDYTLNRAIERFQQSQRRLGGNPSVTAELVTVRGMETTALRFGTATGVVRSVTVNTTDAAHIAGIAVPYNEPSTPVAVSGIRTLEQFDRDSFDYLPTSVPLRIAHDYQTDPLGRVTVLRHTKTGLAIEAHIDPDQRHTWLPRWIRGEYSSLSVGFAGAAILDDWTTSGGLPLRTVRRAQLIEVSVVPNPAYRTARITEVLGPR